MTRYEKIAEWIIAQDVSAGLKDSDIREIADTIFNEQLTSKGIKLVKDALLARNYTNFKDAKFKDSKPEYEFEFNYNIYWDVPTDDKGNPEYKKTYEDEIEDITRLAEEDYCKVVSWKKLTKGPDNISVKFRGNLINLKRLCSHIGVEDLEKRAVKIKDAKVKEDIDYLVYDDLGNDYYCVSLEEVKDTIDSLKEEETDYKGVEAYFSNGKVWFDTYEELEEYVDDYNNRDDYDDYVENYNTLENMNSDFRDCDNLVGKKISWDRRALYGVILSKNDPLTNKTSIEETSTGKVYYVSTRLLNKAIENGEAKIRDSKFKDSADWETLKKSKDFILRRLFKELEKEKSRPMSVEQENNIAEIKSEIRKRAREIKNVPNDIYDKKVKDNLNLQKDVIDYIKEALDNEGIGYEIENDFYGSSAPFDTWITITEGDDSRADDIICSIVGYAYEWVKDRDGNRKYCKVVTDPELIDEFNGNGLSVNDSKFKDSPIWIVVKRNQRTNKTVDTAGGDFDDRREASRFASDLNRDDVDPGYIWVVERSENFKDAKLNTYECSVCYGNNELECFDVQARNITSAKNKAYKLSKYLKGGDCKLYIIQYPEDWDGKTNELRDAKLTRKQKLWYGEELEKFIHPQYLRRNYQLKRIKRKRGK